MLVPHILSSFCPCPEFVQFMSYFCPNFVLFLSLSKVCPDFVLNVQVLSSQNPGFVLIFSGNRVFVHILSQLVTQIPGKIIGQFMDKMWTRLFSHKPPGHPAAGQKLDNLWTLLLT